MVALKAPTRVGLFDCMPTAGTHRVLAVFFPGDSQ